MQIYKVFSYFIFVITLSFNQLIFCAAYPISYSIPEKYVVNNIPKKDKDFAYIIPGKRNTYIYNNQQAYYADYQRSYFAITKKKGGWDCLRHYEILANGCIPYFLDLENCPKNTMHNFPKSLVIEAMHLPGVSKGRIDHKVFDKTRYFEILKKLLKYCRQHLTCKQTAKNLLLRTSYQGCGTILVLGHPTKPDYLRCLTLIGLKELLGQKVIDIPKISHIYETYSQNPLKLYGKGFTYTRIVPDLPIDRTNLEKRIKNREFALIIFGAIHRGMPHRKLVEATYPPEKIVYLCEADDHVCQFSHLPNLFIREFQCLK